MLQGDYAQLPVSIIGGADEEHVMRPSIHMNPELCYGITIKTKQNGTSDVGIVSKHIGEDREHPTCSP